MKVPIDLSYVPCVHVELVGRRNHHGKVRESIENSDNHSPDYDIVLLTFTQLSKCDSQVWATARPNGIEQISCREMITEEAMIVYDIYTYVNEMIGQFSRVLHWWEWTRSKFSKRELRGDFRVLGVETLKDLAVGARNLMQIRHVEISGKRYMLTNLQVNILIYS